MTQILLAAILFIQTSNGTVTGRLMSAPGVPAVGVRVTAKSVSDSATPASPDVLVSIVQTDSAGRYRLENVPPGRYYITAGLVGSPTYYPGTAVLVDAKAIDITAESTTNVPDFTVQQASLRPPTPAPVIAQDPRYRLVPKLAESVSLDVVQDARGSYEALGKIAGVRILFDQRFVPGTATAFRAQGIDALAALNLLSSQTGNAWTILGRDAIIVVPASFGISNLDLQLPSRDVAEAAAVYPGFRPKPTGSLSFEIKAPGTDAFNTIAKMAGMSVVMDPSVFSKPIQLKLENADIYSALDILSVQGSAFWAPYDSSTILVASDTASSHYDFDLWIVKMFHLSNLKSAQEIIDVGTALRKALSPRTWIPLPMANAILVVDTPKTIALAEKLIADLDKTRVLRSEAAAMDGAGNLFAVEPGGLRNVTPYRTELQPRAGLFSLDSSLPPRQAYEKFAESAGIRVVFDSNLFPGQLPKLDNVEFFKALDLISIQTHTFWIPLDSRTIFVAYNNAVNRRDYDPQILKTFYLTHVNTAEGLNNIFNVVRSVANSALFNSNLHANAIIIRDNPRNVALVEMLIGQLDKDPSSSASSATSPVRASAELETYSLSNNFIRDYSGRRNVNPARLQLQPAISGPISIQLNENAKVSYEALARAGGLQVRFDSRFVPGNPVAFRVDNANIVDALNLLSLQTRTFWRVVDSGTILVAPPTSAIRNELEPQIDRTFNLVNTRTPAEVETLVVTIKLLDLTLAVKANAALNAIEIHDTASKIAVAEEIIAALDVP